ncbi:MAG: DHH family phosphoesterase [Oscillospiraceae bacterium]|nr:DHH family phosphoesterase [Oscillospiraceae bacterium]
MTRNECARWLSVHDNFCILTHTRPDGDTIGSASALCVGLRQFGKNAHILNNTQASPFLSRCLLGLTVETPGENDTLVSVDVASPHLFPAEHQQYLSRIALRIDHHTTATSFTPLELVDPSSAATGEIIYELLMEMGAQMTKEIAWRLYIAISTDTGCFRYSNTTAHTYRVAAACAETGADLYPITQELFDTTSISELKLQNWMVEHAQFLCGGQAAVCGIPSSMEQNVSKEDLEGISGFLRSIEGVRISATLREIEGGCKVSVRAVPGLDAGSVCTRFGGGGHKGAGGATLALPMEEAINVVAAALKNALEE